MLIYEYKLRLFLTQRQAIDEASRMTPFFRIRNKALCRWMDGRDGRDSRGVGRADRQARCAKLAQNFPFAARLNSMARQTVAERAWKTSARFYENCRTEKPGKKGYPRFQRDNPRWSRRRRAGAWSGMAGASPSH
jgi:putative transposase